MALSPEQLSSQLKQLKRGPAPKAPVVPSSPTSPVSGMGEIDFTTIKLKKTGMRHSLIEGELDIGKDKKRNELDNVFAAKRKMFEQGNEKPATMPRVAPKSWKTTQEEIQKLRSDSLPDSMKDSNENIVNKGGTPKLRPLPTLQSIGVKPPEKASKPPILIMKIEKKYKNHQVVIAPKVKTDIVEEVKNGTIDQDIDIIEEDIYDDINTGANVPDTPSIPIRKPPPLQPVEPELIEEDTYDDVEQLAEVVKSQLGQTQAGQNIGGLNIDNADGVEFGEELYQPVEGTFSFERTTEIDPADFDVDEEQPETVTQPPSSKESKEDIKAKKERERKEKELQKKKERDEQRRKKEEERRERDDKKKKEDEKRRREKIYKDVKKAHKLKGNEPAICKGTTKEDFAGTGSREIPCTKGSLIEVIVKDNCPNGKWLVRDQHGHLGYVPLEIIQLEVNPEDTSVDANLDEDLYECVETFQNQSVPPSFTSMSNEINEELYDDTVAVEDEDFYEDLPGGN